MFIIRKIYSFLIDTLQSLLIAAAVFLVIYQFLFRPFQVKGDSMYPNFHNDSYVITNIIGLKLQTPKHGDVLVFKAPPEPEKAFIKRVIAIPGDSVEIREGRVYLNGRVLNESAYLNKNTTTSPGAFLKEGEEVKVGPNQYIMMGDNRNFSSDSREWGFVSIDNITGYSWFVYWPISEAKFVDNPLTP